MTTDKNRPEWAEDAVRTVLDAFNGAHNRRTELALTVDRPISIGCFTSDASHGILYRHPRLQGLNLPGTDLRDIAKRLDHDARAYRLSVTLTGRINGVEHPSIGFEVTAKHLDRPHGPLVRVDWMSYQFEDAATDAAKHEVYELALQMWHAVFDGEVGANYMTALWEHHVRELRDLARGFADAAIDLAHAIDLVLADRNGGAK